MGVDFRLLLQAYWCFLSKREKTSIARNMCAVLYWEKCMFYLDQTYGLFRVQGSGLGLGTECHGLG